MINFRFAGKALMMALTSTAASADDWITPKLAGQPERTFVSKQPFYEVERCIVYSAVRGWVYRTPDRPKETLWIDAGRGSSQHILWQLVERDGSVVLNVFEGVSNLNDDTKACFR
jgi:hypothetical protein